MSLLSNYTHSNYKIIVIILTSTRLSKLVLSLSHDALQHTKPSLCTFQKYMSINFNNDFTKVVSEVEVKPENQYKQLAQKSERFPK